MLTGNEYIFDNIDEALKYVLEMERLIFNRDGRYVTEYGNGAHMECLM